jgi:hypothetical protein
MNARGPGASEAMREHLRTRREQRLGTQIGFMDWALKVPEPKGPLDFHRFPMQLELYREGVNDPEIVIKKSTQVGISAFGVRWALYHADTRGMTGLYLFPTARDMWDFSSLRVGPVIRNSPHLSRRQKPDDPDNKGMKGIGLGVVVFRGSEALSGLESVDADHMVFDEYDLLEHEHIPVAERRTGASKYGYKRRIGWPSIPNQGIDRLYEDSDQRKWMVKCRACNEWQTLEFFKNVDIRTGQRICAKCKKELSPDVIRAGEWVARFPDQGRQRGYHVTQLLVPEKSLADLIKASKKRAPHERQSFMNRDLGEAWAPEEGRLSDAAYEAATRDYTVARSVHEAFVVDSPNVVTMGVDVADVRNLNVRVSEHFENGKKRALFIGEVESFTALDELWTKYNVNMGAVDHLPSGRLARAWAERHPGQIYLIALTDTGQMNAAKKPWDVDDDMMTATVNRTVALDAMLETIRAQQNMLPSNPPDDYKEHLQAPNRVVATDNATHVRIGRGGKQDNPPRATRVFYRSAGPDDYAMAEVFDVVATELYWRRVLLDDAEREVFSVLDDEVDFERSHLSHLGDDGDYHAGGREEEIDRYYTQ